MPRPRGPARDQLLEAAQRLLLERGYEAAALDEVCATAQVTKGGLFYHFQSKEQLAAAAVEHFYSQLVDKGRHAMGATPADPVQMLWRYLDAVVALLLQDPLLSRGCLLGAMALQTPQTHPAVAAAAQTALGDWKATLTELISAAARHRAASVDAGALADGLLAAIEGGLLLDRDKPANPAAVAAVTHFGHYLKLTLTQGAAR
jgi:TetR/AcrR family transcriptional regulator, transcriptional repressor for nem operon